MINGIGIRHVTINDIVPSIRVAGFTDRSTPQKMLITKEDFQKRMLDYSDRTLDGGRNKKKTFVADGFRVVVTNQDKEKDGDFEVDDIQDVRDMIKTYKKWKSAHVVELEYDTKGYVTVAKIEALY